MGRKLKSILALVIVLGMIYWQQSSILHAEVPKEAGTWKALDTSRELERPEQPEAPEEPEIPEQPEVPEEPEPPEEPIECFHVSIPPEDGENGYYITKPEVEITHVSGAGVTKYQFADSEGQMMEGELAQKDDAARIEGEQFKEGINRLSIWMEDGEGKQVEEYRLDKEFLIDTQVPAIWLGAPRGFEAWYQETASITVTGEDGELGSQIEEVVCASGNSLIGKSKELPATFQVAYASAKGNSIKITVTARDRAGNTASRSCGLYIDRQPPKARIEGIEDYMITSKPVEVRYFVEEENVMEDMRAWARREDPQGNAGEIPVSEWSETESGKCARQVLTDDGIYQLSLSCMDKAGYEAGKAARFIIDTKSPLISYVDRLDNQYLKRFCWNYPASEWIRDFTSYTYTILLDGRIYPMGQEVLEEGRHTLEVKAIDAAGNTGTAKARFVIDHTPAQVVFQDVEDGKDYEEEKTFQVTLEDQEDQIDEIKINGEVQKTNKRSRIYQFTVQDLKNYEIEVKASDYAGNQAVGHMQFQVSPKKTVFQRLIKPIEKKLKADAKEKNEKTKKWPIICMIFIPFLAIAVLIYYKKRKKNGFSCDNPVNFV